MSRLLYYELPAIAQAQLLAAQHIEDINGRIGLTLLKQAGIDLPAIKAFSHNVGMLLKFLQYIRRVEVL